MNEHEPTFLLFKLASGSSFMIAEILEEDLHVLKVRLPLVFSFQDAGDGEVFVIATKFMHFAQGDIVAIDKRHFVAISSPKQSLIDHYVKWRQARKPQDFEELERTMLRAAHDPSLDDSSVSPWSLLPECKTLQ
jgi:hypothetical protein